MDGGESFGDFSGGWGGCGSRKTAVVWYTQGSGKSLSMVFFAGKLVGADALANPMFVILTDGNDLDQQIFGKFCACSELFRQSPGAG
jgi:type I restriction enzyme R subunit